MLAVFLNDPEGLAVGTIVALIAISRIVQKVRKVE